MSDDTTTPIPLDPPPARRLRRITLTAAVAIVLVLVLGGTVAWAAARDDPSPDPEIATATAHEHDHPDGAAMGDAHAAADAALGRNRHPPLPPYDERYAAASADEQQAADELLADVREALTPYADVNAATAAGYQAPQRARGPFTHYVNPELTRDEAVLDPARPEGLVYFTGGDGEPILLGAFFVAPAGTEAPTPAGDLVVWHSHNPKCPEFFATADDPCLDARRMLHVWSVDQITLPGGRRPNTNGEPVTVQVVDPFGVPFKSSVEWVDS